MGKRVLVVAAHPDDEILGCGGTMAMHSQKGDEVNLMIMGEGITSRDKERNRKKREKEIAQLRKDIEKANRIVGTKRKYILDFPDNRFDSVPILDIIKAFEKIKEEVQPDIIYTHHKGDLNIDHRITFQAVLTGCRPFEGEFVKEIYSFEVPSSTEWPVDSANYFMPNCFVNIKDTLGKKIESLEAYAGEIREYPHPRSIEAVEALARYRGASAGMESAEAFMLIRKIIG